MFMWPLAPCALPLAVEREPTPAKCHCATPSSWAAWAAALARQARALVLLGSANAIDIELRILPTDISLLYPLLNSPQSA